MDEELEMVYEEAKEKMDQAMERLEKELRKIRAGKANPSMLEGIMVDYYGSQTPLKNVSNVSTPDPKTLQIQPFEKSMIEEIEKAIQRANLGFNPQNDGHTVRISIPALTEERRKDLVKMTRGVAEQAKVSIRNGRKDANDHTKGMKKDGLSEDNTKDAESVVQEFTHAYTEKVDAQLVVKEQDIMTI
ncbi:MAG: ribosome recycling factor [Bacteroidia bacterium]|jgi:ribosome recycling factor